MTVKVIIFYPYHITGCCHYINNIRYVLLLGKISRLSVENLWIACAKYSHMEHIVCSVNAAVYTSNKHSNIEQS